MTAPPAALRKRASHLWARDANEHYVEEAWCSMRLLQEEQFEGGIHDPCCGFGRIPEAAMSFGMPVTASDIADRGFKGGGTTCDFLTSTWTCDNVVTNPPFGSFRQFAFHALALTSRKVAMIWQVPRLNAAGWLRDTPLRRIWLMTPRPSMPPGHVVRQLEADGKRPSGGTQDYCWLVWEHGFGGHHRFSGHPEVRWLHREAK